MVDYSQNNKLSKLDNYRFSQRQLIVNLIMRNEMERHQEQWRGHTVRTKDFRFAYCKSKELAKYNEKCIQVAKI